MKTPIDLRSLLGLEHPIIQAPMAGGPTTPELVAAVSNAGALGSLAAPYLSPDQIREAVAEIRRRTDRPFSVNVFCGGFEARAVDPGPMLALVARYHAELGLPAPTAPAEAVDPFEAQFEAILELRPAAFSFTFGIPSPGAMARLKGQGILTLGTATTVEEACQLESAGVDVVLAQGAEAGGHRGTFAGPFESAMIGTMALVPQIVDAVSVPVVAAGGIMDGRGIVAARALGASGVQLGTAFLACPEAGTPAAHQRAILDGREDETVITRAFSGRPARGLANEFDREARAIASGILPYPLQNSLTRPMRTAAAAKGDARLLSLWAGQGVGLSRAVPAAELVRDLVRETEEVSRGLAGG